MYNSVFFGDKKKTMINKYRTKNCRIIQQRCRRYLNKLCGLYKDFRLNNVVIFKELPDDVTILTDYADQIVLRSMILHKDIILHSIYIKYPELFEY